MAETQTFERMVKFDQTFKLVMDHVRKMLDISPHDLNRHINLSIFGNKLKEPSVMLKYYNELLQNTNFCLPGR